VSISIDAAGPHVLVELVCTRAEIRYGQQPPPSGARWLLIFRQGRTYKAQYPIHVCCLVREQIAVDRAVLDLVCFSRISLIFVVQFCRILRPRAAMSSMALCLKS
jgi:hypothetical protein